MTFNKSLDIFVYLITLTNIVVRLIIIIKLCNLCVNIVGIIIQSCNSFENTQFKQLKLSYHCIYIFSEHLTKSLFSHVRTINIPEFRIVRIESDWQQTSLCQSHWDISYNYSGFYPSYVGSHLSSPQK